MFELALAVCEIIIFITVDFENVGQVHVVEKRDLRHRLRISTDIQVIPSIFALALTVCEIYF